MTLRRQLDLKRKWIPGLKELRQDNGETARPNPDRYLRILERRSCFRAFSPLAESSVKSSSKARGEGKLTPYRRASTGLQIALLVLLIRARTVP
jgi:hypothetical protein